MLKPKKKLTRREIKEDKLVTTWFKATEYLEQHVREALYILAGVVVVIVGIVLYNRSKVEAEESASVEFARAKTEYTNRNYAAAIDILKNVITNYSGTKSATVAIIYLANAYMQNKDYENAGKYYRQYLDDEGDDPILSVAAAAGVAATFDERGNYAEAAKLYEKAANDFEDSYRAPQLLMSAARCYKLTGQPEGVRRVGQNLLDKYPKSGLADEVKLLMAEAGEARS
jgi:TolA-binding protein